MNQSESKEQKDSSSESAEPHQERQPSEKLSSFESEDLSSRSGENNGNAVKDG